MGEAFCSRPHDTRLLIEKRNACGGANRPSSPDASGLRRPRALVFEAMLAQVLAPA
jgi:hypothetical protein